MTEPQRNVLVTATAADGQSEPRPRAARKGRDLRRLARYGFTSVLAFGVSEVVLLVLGAATHLGATTEALIANLVGVLPSYGLSRYWIWSEADRRRPVGQASRYWLTSVASMVISSFATGFAAHHAPRGHNLHLVVLGGAYFLISVVLWVAKYVAYQTVVFRTPAIGQAEPTVAGQAVAAPVPVEVMAPVHDAPMPKSGAARIGQGAPSVIS